MPGFCAVFNCSYCADIEKDKSNYRFLSIIKNNNKKAWDKSWSVNSQEIFIWEKSRKNKNKS